MLRAEIPGARKPNRTSSVQGYITTRFSLGDAGRGNSRDAGPGALKAALRKVFTDHANYTSELISANFPVLNGPFADAVGARLSRNPADIAVVFEDFSGPSGRSGLAPRVREAFAKHLEMAAAVLPLLRSGSPVLDKAVAALYSNGNQVADVLGGISPGVLSPATAREAVRRHNEFVVKLAQLRKGERYREYVRTYDDYYDHILQIADSLKRPVR